MPVDAGTWEGTMVGFKCCTDDVFCFEDAGECWFFVGGGDFGRRFDFGLQFWVCGGAVGGGHGVGCLLDWARCVYAGGRWWSWNGGKDWFR